MKRFIGIIVLLIFILGIGVFEEIFIRNFLKELNIKSTAVSALILENQDDLNVENLKDEFEDLKSFWSSSKNVICYLANYEKIKIMDECFVKLGSAIKTNDLNLANENMAIVKSSGEFLNYLMGFNINNLL